MGYQRQVRHVPNKIYDEVDADAVKYWFDVLQVPSLKNIARETGFKKDFVRKTLNEYKSPKLKVVWQSKSM